MHWKLKVSGYGKIKSAEIETAPLTLFVGDNNSGKSYLMSLLWIIQNFSIVRMLFGRYKTGTKSVRAVIDWFKMRIEIACKEKVHKVSAGEIAMDLQAILQDAAEISQNLKYIPNDLLKAERIKVYQLKCGPDGMTEVEELKCGKNTVHVQKGGSYYF